MKSPEDRCTSGYGSINSKGSSNRPSHSNTGDTLSSSCFQIEGILSEKIRSNTGVCRGGIERLSDTCMKFVLRVSGDSVLADTIPRSITKVDGITEVWVVLSRLTGLGGTRVNTNPALAMENTSIMAIGNSNVWCDADWRGEVGVPDWISVQSAGREG